MSRKVYGSKIFEFLFFKIVGQIKNFNNLWIFNWVRAKTHEILLHCYFQAHVVAEMILLI